MGLDTVRVKYGDTRPVPLTAGGFDPTTRAAVVADLTGATLVIVARERFSDWTLGEPIVLSTTAGTLTAGQFNLIPDFSEGMLEEGKTYACELEETQGTDPPYVYPSRQDDGRQQLLLVVERRVR